MSVSNFYKCSNDGFRGWSDDEFFLEFGCGVDNHTAAVFCVFKTVVCHYGAFLCESLYVFCLAAEE